MGFSTPEYWSGLPFPSPGDLPDPGVKPGSPALKADSLPIEPPGKPSLHYPGPKQRQKQMGCWNWLWFLSSTYSANLSVPTFPSPPDPCLWDPERSHPTEAFRDTCDLLSLRNVHSFFFFFWEMCIQNWFCFPRVPESWRRSITAVKSLPVIQFKHWYEHNALKK